LWENSERMALTKADIADSVSKRVGMTRNRSLDVVETLLELMKKTLEDGEDVLITGFGKFCVKNKKQRKGRNPQTGGEMILAPRRVVTFQCSGILRKKINGR
jgi:integration host factor subunit alpha